MSRCVYNDFDEAAVEPCTVSATYKVSYQGEDYLVCAEHAEKGPPGDSWDNVEPIETKPKEKGQRATKQELKEMFDSFFKVRDAMKGGSLRRLKPSEAAVLWQYLINAMYKGRDYGKVATGCTSYNFLSDMTTLSPETIRVARKVLHEEHHWIDRSGRDGISVLPFLEVVRMHQEQSEP